MPKIIATKLKHYNRTEEQEILQYVERHNNRGHISVFGLSGTGKTDIIVSSMKLLHSGDLFNRYTVLHYDASQVPEECSMDIFCNLLIYKLLQRTNCNERNQTQVEENNTFLKFLEKSTYRKEVKNNAKKALIASLSLLPTVGTLIHKILNVEGESVLKDYHTNKYLFGEYLDNLSKNTGLMVFIDNIQYLSPEIINEFFELLRQIDGNILVFTSYTLKNDTSITRKLVEENKLDEKSLILNVENVTIDIFDEICYQNLKQEHYYAVKKRLEPFYALVQYGNLKEIDELIFQIKYNGVENIKEVPTLQGIRELDEVNKDIIDLAALFPEGIKISFVEKIIRYNHGYNTIQLRQSISNLCKMKYILVGENDTLNIEHEKISQASRQNLECADEEERFAELLHSCKTVFSEILYEPIDDSDFFFCFNAIMEFEQQFNFLKHLGVFKRYINILYTQFRYYQICQIYRTLVNSINDGNKLVFLLPICTLVQLLDSFQKTSCFEEGLEISNQLSGIYNLDLYKAKFLLQSYNYQEAINTLNNRLTNYESWSIYLNALQHLRHDNEVREKVLYLQQNMYQYSDIEYFFIILRNSGHLIPYNDAINNLSMALEYFQNIDNKFVESTCLNNIGILFLYQSQEKENIHIARKYFNKAKRIMHELNSNEEYQSMINIGVSYLCENNFALALEYFENAQTIMPNGLSFDMMKLKCNILICKYLMKSLDIHSVRDELLELCSEAEYLPDPWIRLLCEYNLHILRNSNNAAPDYLATNYPGDMNLYGLILKNNLQTDSFMLGISPHWRY